MPSWSSGSTAKRRVSQDSLECQSNFDGSLFDSIRVHHGVYELNLFGWRFYRQIKIWKMLVNRRSRPKKISSFPAFWIVYQDEFQTKNFGIQWFHRRMQLRTKDESNQKASTDDFSFSSSRIIAGGIECFLLLKNNCCHLNRLWNHIFSPKSDKNGLRPFVCRQIHELQTRPRLQSITWDKVWIFF